MNSSASGVFFSSFASAFTAGERTPITRSGGIFGISFAVNA